MDLAPEFSRCWRDKQLEYSFRRGLMATYARLPDFPDALFDPWGIEPDMTVPDLDALAERLV